MPFSVGGEFLPNPRNGDAVDFIMDTISRHARGVRDLMKDLRAAPTAAAKRQLIEDLRSKRKATKAGYIGLVKVRIGLSDPEATVVLNLEKRITEEDWPAWEAILNEVNGLEQVEHTRAYQVTLTLAEFYRDKLKAVRVARDAIELLHLTTGSYPIEFEGEEG